MHNGRRPSEIPLAVSMSVVVSCWISFAILHISNELGLFLACAIITAGAMLEGIFIYRLITFRRVFSIEMKPAALRIKNAEIEAGNIKMIFIKGYFKPVIGVKPKDHLLVPYKYCFCFSDKEDQGIKDIEKWAEQHQVEVLHKGFKRWL